MHSYENINIITGYYWQRWKIKIKTLRYTGWLHFSNFHQLQYSSIWSFHNSYVILELVSRLYSVFLDRVQLVTQNLLKQGYIALRLRSPLRKLCVRHHDLVDRYEISISQMEIQKCIYFPFYDDFSFLYYRQDFLPDLIIWVPRRVSYEEQELVTIREHLSSPPFFWWSTCC